MRWASWCSAIIVVSLSACASYKVGQAFNDRSVKNIRTGKTTRAEVIQMFGQPITRNSSGGGKEVWQYYYTETRANATPITYVPIVGMFAGGGKGSTNSQKLSIQFAGDIVSECRYGKTTADVTTGAMGLSTTPSQQSSVTTPCNEAQ